MYHPLTHNTALGFHQVNSGLKKSHPAFYFILLCINDFPAEFNLLADVVVLLLVKIGNLLLEAGYLFVDIGRFLKVFCILPGICLLYTSDAADEL